MIGSLPALDVHAHLASDEDFSLAAVVVAVANSLEAAELARRGPRVVPAIGVHPADERALMTFDSEKFAEALKDVAVIGEVGLDGRLPRTKQRQRDVFSRVLDVAHTQPRMLSIHSVRAHGPVLDALAATPADAPVLHWWTGTPAQTKRALQLGCWFSVNAAQAQRRALLQMLPPERVLTETDHPFGHGRGHRAGRPGDTAVIEAALAGVWRCDAWTVRRRVWQNFAEIVARTAGGELLPREAQRAVLAVG